MKRNGTGVGDHLTTPMAWSSAVRTGMIIDIGDRNRCAAVAVATSR
jgi:hypothetical protein